MKWWKDWRRSWTGSSCIWGLWSVIVMFIKYEGFNHIIQSKSGWIPPFPSKMWVSLDAKKKKTRPPRRRWWHPRFAESVPDDRPWNPAKFPQGPRWNHGKNPTDRCHGQVPRVPHLQLGWKSCGLFQSHGHIQQKLRGRPGTEGLYTFGHLRKKTPWRVGRSSMNGKTGI